LKNRKKLEINHEENFLVNAILTVHGAEINAVPCKIYLPERIYEKPYIIFKPQMKDSHRIMTLHKGELRASVFGFDQKLQTTIEAPKVYFSASSTKHWGDDISETTVSGEPQDLHIVNHFSTPETQEKTSIVFWVSPNEFLTPFMMCENSYTGDVNYELVSNLTFLIKDDVQIVLEKHFASKIEINDDFVQWSFLVATTDLSIAASDVESLKGKVLPNIDDFLLIASFAARKRTSCLGWTATDNNSHSTFYRGNHTFPKGSDDVDIEDGVLDIQSFKEFMEVSYSSFLRYENKLALRNALYTTVPASSQAIETSFLSYFSGLETLILDFRRQENIEFILQEDEWKDLRSHLEKSIKSCIKPKLEREKRALIYSKLGELNRVSLREAFEVFCAKYEINLNDLWPVFGNKEMVGLVDIRNKLIHGDPFPHELFNALILANSHLKYTLERVILRIFGWDVEETKVSQNYLKAYFIEKDNLSFEQVRISEYINN